MFGFLKKKLKEAVEKISGAAKPEEVSAEQIEEEGKEAELKEELKAEAMEKKELIRDAGMDITPEAEEAIEKPAKQILEEKKRDESDELREQEIQEHETPPEQKTDAIEPDRHEALAEPKAVLETGERKAAQKKAKEKKPEIIAIKRPIKSGPVKPEAELPESVIEMGEEQAENKSGEAIVEEAEMPEKKEPIRRKGLLERLGVKKKPEDEPAAPARELPSELPPDLDAAKDTEKKEGGEKAGLFRRIKKAVSEKKLEEADIKDILWDLQIGLIENDVAVDAAEKIASDLKGALVGKTMPRKGIEETVRGSMKKSVKEIIDAGEINLEERIKSKKPFLAVFLGFNGVGKTTAIARVGHLLKEGGFSCIFAAADTWRAGAIQQIEEHGNRLGIKVIRQEYGSDPAAIIFDARKYAEAHGIDVILADTAGRSHTNANLVDELKKICRVNNPDLKVLVLDALTGNDVIEQTKYFNDAVGADCMIITKADVYERGGSILSAVHTIRKPILFLGVGQGYGDLEKFSAEKVAESLLE